MAYGKLKVDTITYDDSGTDTDVSVSDLAGAGSAAPLNSPTFTGTPAAPTAAVGTNTTQLATTAFVTANALPLAGGTLTGDLVLSGDPDANLKAATKQYVDNNTVDASGGSFTGDVTFAEAISIERVKEKVSISTTGVTGQQHFNAKDQTIVFHNADTTGNYSINARGDASTTLNSLMDIGQVLTGVFITKYGSTAYFPSTFTVDGSTPSLVRWVGGAPSSAGTANSVCAITFSVIKTADATFTALLSQTEYEA